MVNSKSETVKVLLALCEWGPLELCTASPCAGTGRGICYISDFDAHIRVCPVNYWKVYVQEL